MSSTRAAPFAIAAGLLLALSCHAQQADTVHIEADNMQHDFATGSSTYIGNVVLRKPGMTLQGDRIIIRQGDSDDGDIEMFGKPAEYEQDSEGVITRAQSEYMFFDGSENILTMRVNATLHHANQVITSEYIRFNTDDQVLLAGQEAKDQGVGYGEGDETGHRVNITLTPGKENE